MAEGQQLEDNPAEAPEPRDDEGSIQFTWRPIRQRWLPDTVRRLMEFQDPRGIVVRLDYHPDGHLTFSVRSAEQNYSASFDTQPITFEGERTTKFVLTWNGSHLNVYIAGRLLEPYEPGQRPLIIDTGGIEEPEVLSVDHPDARATCQPWMDRRTAQFGTPKATAREGHILKEDRDQFEELRTVVLRLQRLVEQVKAGELFLVGALASDLRALVYWPDIPRRTYNPLLLRLAARLDLPLPIYGERFQPITVPMQPDVQHNDSPIRLMPITAEEELMDLQEWLADIVQVENLPGETRTLSKRDLILSCATTLGAAHYDEDFPAALQQLRQLYKGEIDGVNEFIRNAAEAVAAMGTYVLQEAEKQGFGRPSHS